MENGKKNFLVCFSVGVCFILLLSPASAENKTEPRRNANLSPFESWRSAYFCLKNTSWACAPQNRLTFNGTLLVPESEMEDYCWGGCYEHTLKVLQCVEDVKRDFKFEINAPLWFVKNTIVTACSTQNQTKGFNITKYNSATSLYGRLYMPLVSTLTTLAFIATFNA